jgi:uncharacterized protein
MQTYLKTRPVWIQLILFIGMSIGILMTISLIGALILSKMTGLNLLEFSNPESWDPKKPGMLTFMRGMIFIQFLGLFLIPSLLFAYFSDPNPKQYLGLKPPTKFFYWIAGTAALLLAIPLVDFLGNLNKNIHFGTFQQWAQDKESEAMRMIQFMLSGNTINDLFINLVFIAVFAGVGEELFFRGILQRLLIKATKDPWMGIVIAAFLFSFFHFQFFGFFPRFLLGILLGVMYWYSGSLWVAIVAHFLYDAFFIIVAHFNPQLVTDPDASVINPSYLAITAIVSAAIIVALVWVMKKHSTTSYKEVYAGEEDENGFEKINNNNGV